MAFNELNFLCRWLDGWIAKMNLKEADYHEIGVKNERVD